MSAIELEQLRKWLGTTHVDEDHLGARHARLMAATVCDTGGQCLEEGDRLPPLWHWVYFLEGRPAAELGRDGHPARGGFLPPVPLSNRMWAGGRVAFLAPIRLGDRVRKRSRILRIDHKTGRSGDLVFVTVLHELENLDGQVCVREEHDIVFRDAPRGGALSRFIPVSHRIDHQRTLTPTSTQLFRYSALTFNGHRIHYDVDYCRTVEGYDNLVIHGPLTATLLAGFAEEISGLSLARFDYRAVAPALLGETLTLNACIDAGRIMLSATLSSGSVSMTAEAEVTG